MLYYLIALCVCFLVYAIVRYPVYHLSKSFLQPGTNKESPKLSVVVTAHNNGATLQTVLQTIATQEYPDFEVIVVNDASDDDTSDIITLIENQYPNVHHTFTPETARSLSHAKLAITLGVKAARNEWIVLTQGDCQPQSDLWLARMASACTSDKDFVLGYANFFPAKQIFHRRIAFARFLQQLRYYRLIGSSHNGRPGGAANENMAFRRSLFLEHKGFYSNVQLLGGEDRFFIDEAGVKGRVTALLCDDAHVCQQPPLYRQTWCNYRLSETAAARRLSSHARMERFLWGLSSLCLFAYIAIAACIAYVFYTRNQEAVSYLIGLLVLVEQFVAGLILTQSARKLNEPSCFFILFLRNFTQPCHTLYYKLSTMRNRRNLMRGEA